MTNTARIQANNADLRECIDIAKNLPNAGTGGNAEIYKGTYEVTPSIQTQTLDTAQKVLEKNVTINKIPYAEVTNNSNGKTVTIG